MHILDIEKTLVTQQQESGFFSWRKAQEEDGCTLTFKDFYMYWQEENGLFDDSHLFE